ELEELGGAQDRVRNPRGPDQVLLRQLGAEVSVFRKAIGPDHGQRNMVPHFGGGLGSENIAARRFEECQNRAVLEGRRIRDIDDNFGTRKDLVEALARDRVDARTASRWNHFVAFLTEPARELGSNEAGTANNDNLHDSPSIFLAPLLLKAARECARAGRKALQPR